MTYYVIGYGNSDHTAKSEADALRIASKAIAQGYLPKFKGAWSGSPSDPGRSLPVDTKFAFPWTRKLEFYEYMVRGLTRLLFKKFGVSASGDVYREIVKNAWEHANKFESPKE